MSITIHCEYCDVIIQIFYFFPFNHQIKKVLAAKTFDRRARSEPKIEGLATNHNKFIAFSFEQFDLVLIRQN